MPPARKAALQWLAKNGEASGAEIQGAYDSPSWLEIRMLIRDGQVSRRDCGGGALDRYSLTDKGRRDLQEAGR